MTRQKGRATGVRHERHRRRTGGSGDRPSGRRIRPARILVNNAGINTLAHRVTLDELPGRGWSPSIWMAVLQVSRPERRVMRGKGRDGSSTSPQSRGSCRSTSTMRVYHAKHRHQPDSWSSYGFSSGEIAPRGRGTKRLFRRRRKFSESKTLPQATERPDEIAVSACFSPLLYGHILTAALDRRSARFLTSEDTLCWLRPSEPPGRSPHIPVIQ